MKWYEPSGNLAHHNVYKSLPKIDLDYLRAKSNMVTKAFAWFKVETQDFPEFRSL